MSLAATSMLVVLILSGGDSPTGNNYSQYLQAKRMNQFFRHHSKGDVTTLFGSGINSGNKMSMAPDVQRKTALDGDVILEKGVLSHNQAATYQKVLTYFNKTLAKQRWKTGSRFLLFVDDHGMPNQWDPTDIRINNHEVEAAYNNNCINLWLPGISAHPEHACLSTSQLRQLLTKVIPNNTPVNFVMSQCFSGGFHQLGFIKDSHGMPHKVGETCGFTSVPKFTYASGCTVFVDEKLYDGYERRIAEAITGRSVMTGKKLQDPIYSLSKAHDMAFMTDNTKDVPTRTSEAYLQTILLAKHDHRQHDDHYPIGPIETLNPIWLELSNKQFSGIPKRVHQDLERRLDLIRSFRIQLMQWHPLYTKNLLNADLHQVSLQRQTFETMRNDLKKRIDAKRDEFNKVYAPIKAAYLLDLKEKDNEESHKTINYIMYSELDHHQVYTRFHIKDKTLKTFQAYLNFLDKMDNTILTWAKSQKNMLNVELATQYHTELQLMTAHFDELDLLAGQFHRLESQMMIATGSIWLFKQKYLANQQIEFMSFIDCENQATARSAE